MRNFLLMIAVVALVVCGEEKQQPEMGPASSKVTASDLAEAKAEVKTTAEEERPEKPLISDPVVEKAIRKELKKPTGELTKADLEKVTELYLGGNRLTSVKGLEQLTQLTELSLSFNQLTGVKGLENLTQLE